MRYIFAVLLFLHTLQFTHAAQLVCKAVDWREHATEVEEINNKFISNQVGSHPNIYRLFNGMGNAQMVLDKSTPASADFKMLNYDYNIQYQVTDLNFTGLEFMKINPIEILGPQKLRLNVSLLKDLDMVVGTAINITQITQSGCAVGEEKFKKYCFKTCDSLTDGKYPVRVSSKTCAKSTCPDGLDLSPSDGKCYRKSCPPEYPVENGRWCRGNCSTLYGSGYSSWKNHCMSLKNLNFKQRPVLDRSQGVLPEEISMGNKKCGGYSVNAKGGCPTSFYKWCPRDAFRFRFTRDPGECSPILISPTLRFIVSQPSVMVDVEFNISSASHQSPIELIKKLFENNPTETETGVIQRKFSLKNIMSLKVLNVRYDFKKAKKIEIDWFNSGYVGAIFEFVTDLIRYLLNKGGKTHDYILRQLSTISQSLANVNIQKKLEPRFNNKCN